VISPVAPPPVSPRNQRVCARDATPVALRVSLRRARSRDLQKAGTWRSIAFDAQRLERSCDMRLKPTMPGVALACATVLLLATTMAVVADDPALTPREQLGKAIFFDEDLSLNANQSCASCHAPEVGFTGPLSFINEGGAVYEGSVPGMFGDRKPPSSAYATYAPILHYVMDKKDVLFIGGNFWDGRATGEKLGNPAADQAQGPFLNPMEQALPDAACVVYRVCNASYPVSFESVWGAGACTISWPADVATQCANPGGYVSLSPADRANVSLNYDRIGLTIADYEASPESNAFTSKYDAYVAGLVDLTKEEKQGLNFFRGKGKCAKCHVLESPSAGVPALLTDFTFDNLGLPKNPDNPVYARDPDFVDPGLGGFLTTRADYAAYADDNLGKHKVPTLRNVAKGPAGLVKAFGHNGYFKSLEGIVHFYSTRDLKPRCPADDYTEADALASNCWPAPEVAENVNTSELGSLHLTPAQEAAIVAFLKTLSDGYAR
jgi:cytochrome c peroxidase